MGIEVLTWKLEHGSLIWGPIITGLFKQFKIFIAMLANN